jgi:rhodanese-related sulfurtransferase
MQESIRHISPKDMYEFMRQDARVHLLDVRSPDEFSNQHVNGSSNLPLDQLNQCSVAEQLGVLAGREEPLFLLCASGKRSEMAAAKLAGQGLENIATVSGGTGAWRKARLPLVVKRRLPTLEQQAQIFLGVIILLALVKASLISPWFYTLAGLVGIALIYSGVTACNQLSSLLARLPWNQQSSSA